MLYNVMGWLNQRGSENGKRGRQREIDNERGVLLSYYMKQTRNIEQGATIE